jgi:hypothetical protein
MGVRVIVEDEIPWRDGSEMVEDGKVLRAHSRFPIAHFETGPWFGRAKYDPGMRVEAHWHPCNEVLYITQGELTVGGEAYKAGTALAIDEGTVYGPLVAGPEGAEFLTIRDKQPQGVMKPENAPKRA